MVNLSESQKKAVEKLQKKSSDSEFFWDDKNSTPQFVKGTLTQPSEEEPSQIAKKFLEENRDLLGLSENLVEQLEIIRSSKDKWGFTHVFFKQILNGIPVYKGTVQVHINKNGQIISYKDNRLAKLEVNLEPKISSQEAIINVVKTKFKTEFPPNTIRTAFGTATDPNQIESKSKEPTLIFIKDPNQKVHLAWDFTIKNPQNLEEIQFFVDAHSNKILHSFSKQKQILSRQTHTANFQPVLPGQMIIDDDNSPLQNNESAIQAHENVKIVYEYFYEKFKRDSFDGNGSNLISTVDFREIPSESFFNAFWNGHQMAYGDGDPSNGILPFSYAIDIVGHELTHAIGDRTANFEYYGQSGALDESFADFFGIMVSEEGPISDWEIGEGVFPGGIRAIRDFSNPPRFDQPDHMDHFFPDPFNRDHGGVHSNSGIPNKAAYLIINGGIHYGISVSGIGREKAENIYFLALTEYLGSTTTTHWTFNQGRMAILNACRQLYGDSGVEYASIKNAWASVGIGEPAQQVTKISSNSTPNLDIPDNYASGITDSISITDQGNLLNISIVVDITHTWRGDLQVVLVSPDNTEIILHNRKGRSLNNLKRTFDFANTSSLTSLQGKDIEGEWKLRVIDEAQDDIGTLNKWIINLSYSV